MGEAVEKSHVIVAVSRETDALTVPLTPRLRAAAPLLAWVITPDTVPVAGAAASRAKIVVLDKVPDDGERMSELLYERALVLISKPAGAVTTTSPARRVPETV